MSSENVPASVLPFSGASEIAGKYRFRNARGKRKWRTRKLPDSLAKFCDSLAVPKAAQLPCLALAAWCYRHCFDTLTIPVQRLRRGWTNSHHGTATAIVRALVDSDFLQIHSQPFFDSKRGAGFGKARRFLVNSDKAGAIYEAARFFYCGSRNALLENRPRRQKRQLAVDRQLQPVLENTAHSWSVKKAFARLMTLPATERARAWPSIRWMTDGDGLSDWRQAAWSKMDGGRLYSFSPCVQAIPRTCRFAMRGNQAAVFNVDISGEHLALVNLQNKIGAQTVTWQSIIDATKLSKATIKGIINPLFNGQTDRGYLLTMRADGDSRSEQVLLVERHRVISELERQGITGWRASELMPQGSRIMETALKCSARKGIFFIPMFDGGIVCGNESKAAAVKDDLQAASESITGQPLPCRIYKNI